nr:TlpA disulfide reductase family protein [uncultured Mucilaginibacter sp.]
MMRYFLLLVLAVLTVFYKSNAQSPNTSAQAANSTLAMLSDLNTVVRDSSGTELAYKDWHSLLTSGNYGIKSYQRGTDKPVLTLYKLTEADRLRNLSLRKQVATEPDAIPAGKLDNGPAASVNYRLPQQSTSFHNGLKMEPFKARDINGNKIDLKMLQGKIVVLNFWFIKCPACRDEMPELDQLATSYAADSDVVFIAISLDAKWKVKDFLKTTSFGYQQISDGNYYSNNYQVDLYPTNIVLDKSGVIKFNSVGSDHTGYWIKKTIEDIKAGN